MKILIKKERPPNLLEPSRPGLETASMKRFLIWVAVAACFVLSFKNARRENKLLIFRNPAALSDAQWVPVTKAPQSRNPTGLFTRTLLSRTFGNPNLSAIQMALWQGDFSGLPFWLLQKYRERGLLQVLALSGQHVWALALCLSCLGGMFWKVYPYPRGKLLLWSRRVKMPLAAAILLGLAPAEPSLMRTAICVFFIFLYQENPLTIEPEYAASLTTLVFLALFPQVLFSKGFQLSFSGVIGVWIMGRCFSSGQKLFALLWVVTWFIPIMAFFFGKWVGDSVLVQLFMGLIWDQVFLPLLFLLGLSILMLPPVLTKFLALGSEKILDLWLTWEALHVKTSGSSVYRPSFVEAVTFLAWLVALAYWNRERCQNVAKKNAYGATCIDLTRGARRQ